MKISFEKGFSVSKAKEAEIKKIIESYEKSKNLEALNLQILGLFTSKKTPKLVKLDNVIIAKQIDSKLLSQATHKSLNKIYEDNESSGLSEPPVIELGKSEEITNSDIWGFTNGHSYSFVFTGYSNDSEFDRVSLVNDANYLFHSSIKESSNVSFVEFDNLSMPSDIWNSVLKINKNAAEAVKKLRLTNAKDFALIVGMLISGGNVLLYGPPSSGKTMMTEDVATLLGIPHSKISMSPETSDTDLIGSVGLSENSTVFGESLAMKSFREGGVFTYDEVNAAPANALLPIHSMIDENRYYQHKEIANSQGVKGEKIVRHPHSFIMATMNYGYAGTRELSEAFLSRFDVFELSAPNQITDILKESAISSSIVIENFEERLINALNEIYIELKAEVERNEVPEVYASVRMYVKKFKSAVMFKSSARDMILTLANNGIGYEYKDDIKDIIKSKLSKYGI